MTSKSFAVLIEAASHNWKIKFPYIDHQSSITNIIIVQKRTALVTILFLLSHQSTVVLSKFVSIIQHKIMAEVVTGSCSICLEKISTSEKGISCKECFRRFHNVCAKRDVRSTRSQNIDFFCQHCSSSKKVLCQLEKLKDIPSKLDGLLKDFDQFKLDVNNDLDDLKSKQAATEENHKECSKKVSNLSIWEYRHELLVSGIPSSVRSGAFVEMITKIALINDVVIGLRDIAYCFRMRNGNIVVKFVSILVKDEIMRSYMRSKNLVLSQIIDTNVTSRVYLNNKFPPESQRLMMYCRKLKKIGLIKKFSINHIDGSIKLGKLDDSTIDCKNFDELRTIFRLPADADETDA